jgi:hypothetical protein
VDVRSPVPVREAISAGREISVERRKDAISEHDVDPPGLFLRDIDRAVFRLSRASSGGVPAASVAGGVFEAVNTIGTVESAKSQ